MLRDIPADEAITAYVDRCAVIADEFATPGVRGQPGSRTARDPVPAVAPIHGHAVRPDHVPGQRPTAGCPSRVRPGRRRRGIGAGTEPRRPTRRRWLIWVHGAAQGPTTCSPSWAAHLHNNLDFELVLPVLPAHGPRSVPGVAYPGFDLILNVLITMRAVAEIRSLIGWIETHDPTTSPSPTPLGGPIAALVALLDPQAVGDGDGADARYAPHPHPPCVPRRYPRQVDGRLAEQRTRADRVGRA